MKRTILAILLISLMLLPAVLAQNANEAFMSDLGEDIKSAANWIADFVTPGEGSPVQNYDPDSMYIPVFATFAFVFTIFFALTTYVHPFNDNKRWGMVVAAVFGVVAVATPGVIEFLWGLSFWVILLIIILVIAFLVLTLTRQLRSGSTKALKDLNKAQREERATKAELHKAKGFEKREKQELNVLKDNIKRENKAINKAEKAAKEEFQIEDDISRKLNHLRDTLQKIERLPTASEEAQKMKESLLREVSSIIASAKDARPISEKIQQLNHQLSKMDTKDLEVDASIEDITKKIEDEYKAVLGDDADKITKYDDKIQRNARELKQVLQAKKHLESEVERLETEEAKNSENFIVELERLIGSVRSGDLNNAYSSMMRAQQIVEEEKRIAQAVSGNLKKLDGSISKMRKLRASMDRLMDKIRKRK